jgi:TRAP-type mannitol/chloroaromatic compound transport system permease small subunit
MRGPIVAFVKAVDAVNYRVGRVAMYLIFVMAAILLASTGSRLVFGVPINWALEMSQFLLSAYYLLGGAYTLQMGGHVRMDLFYDRLSARKRAVTSTEYAIFYNQTNYSSWAPVLWPVKVVMTIGIFLMLLQCVSSFFKDIAIARGKPIA